MLPVLLYQIVARSFPSKEFIHIKFYAISIAKVLTDQGQWFEMLILSNVVRKGRDISEQRVRAVRRKSANTGGKVKVSETGKKEMRDQVIKTLIPPALIYLSLSH